MGLKNFGIYRTKIRKKKSSFLIEEEGVRKITARLVNIDVTHFRMERKRNRLWSGTSLTRVQGTLFLGCFRIYHGFRTRIQQSAQERKLLQNHPVLQVNDVFINITLMPNWLDILSHRRMDHVGQSTPGIHQDLGLSPNFTCMESRQVTEPFWISVSFSEKWK